MSCFHLVKQSVLVFSLLVTLSSCNDSGLITPPPQNLGNKLNTSATEQDPSFSHDSRYLVFTGDRNAKRSIYLYDVQRRRLVSLPGLNQTGSIQAQPDISSDGRYIVYLSEQLGKADIFVYDRTTMQTEHITKNFIGDVRNPTISGNGRYVAFEGNRRGQWDIEIYDRGGRTNLSLPQSSPNDEN